MSHSVTVTRTTTSTTTSAIILNTGYFKTWPGLLKLAELVLGIVVVGIVSYYIQRHRQSYGNVIYTPDLFFLLMAVTFLIGTFLIFFSCLISISTASIINKTVYEVVYHGFAFILYLAASLTFIVEINRWKNSRYHENYDYEPYFAAAVIGLVISVLYLSTFESWSCDSLKNKTSMIPSRGPTIVTVRPSTGQSGLECCCCRCCTCVNLHFLKTEYGVLKILQLVMGFFCQSLAFNFGMSYSGTIGPSFQSFLASASWCLMTTLLLLLCYVVSEKSFGLIKQSLFETLFNAVACFSYISSCSYLGWAVNVFLHPLYTVTPYFQVYPAMSAAYMVGTIVGLVYGYDAYKSYRYYKGYR